ncbi:hypothetical protein ACFOUP_12450 [Belliella kenyensis]|uniref:Uncharacterized protein n=1 Tax=Belliella kenyensis TaxID=1472724 RepID=A0ABV8ELJ3_9BACT|nr:hypothetical protein [Belliella kenyensis]MCH7400782.1 hypothetical protein [Belliella kenyensis]MDN3601930.1 hypothetical protein [Belliella kenyensis]
MRIIIGLSSSFTTPIPSISFIPFPLGYTRVKEYPQDRYHANFRIKGRICNPTVY